MNVETKIKLDKWKPRPYQLPVLDALENRGIKRVVAIWPRRSGKDVCFFNYCIRSALKKTQNIFYFLPTFTQGKAVIWNSITNEGERMLDYLPMQMVESMNSQECRIRFKNGSQIFILGSDNYDRIVGSNCHGMVFSEYALADPRCYTYLRPILVANDGWCAFVSTPRGKNHLYQMYEIARNSRDWFASKLTVEDTHHISLHEIEKERADGLISEDMIQQEYYCSFELGVEGSFYQKYIDKMRLEGRITDVPYEINFPVWTFWDLGVRDSTSIIFAQFIGQTVRIIDYYENQKEGLEHYHSVLKAKGYNYAKHFAPHDIAVKEFGSGLTRWEKAAQMGLKFEMKSDRYGNKTSAVPNISIMDGIEAVRSSFGKIWIDEIKCEQLLKCLENYRQEYDHKLKVYKSVPLHSWASHGADAMRYLCLSLPRTRDSKSAEDLERAYREYRYGENDNMPAVFRNDLPRY